MIFQTTEFLVLNKPVRTHYDDVITRCAEISDPTAWEEVHRLDYETSGCLLVARKEHAVTLRNLFKTGAMKKTYLAGASHELGDESLGRVIEGFIASRYRSSKKVKFVDARYVEGMVALKRKNHSVQPVRHVVNRPSGEIAELARVALGFTGTVYEVDLITGARHQIRAFFAASDATIVGDPVYAVALEETAESSAETEGSTEKIALIEPTEASDAVAGPRLELHAYRLVFADPFRPGTTVDVCTPKP